MRAPPLKIENVTDKLTFEDEGECVYLDIQPFLENGAHWYLETADTERLRDWLTAWLDAKRTL